jgi:hypothetical protein
MNVIELAERVDDLETRAAVLRDLLAYLDRALPRRGANFVFIDGEKKRVRKEVVDEVRRLLRARQAAAWRALQGLQEAEVDVLPPGKPAPKLAKRRAG